MFRWLVALLAAVSAEAIAAPVVDRSVPSPVTNVSREQLENLPTRRSVEDLLRVCPARTIPTVISKPQGAMGAPPGSSLRCVQPDDVQMIDVYRLHNQVRAQVGARPLVWDRQLALQAASYGPQLAQYGRPIHAPRQGRETSRENLLQALPGTRADRMVGVWIAEGRNFVPGVFPNVSRTGNWADVGHYSQMIWPTTTNVGCAIYRSRPFDWLICRYSPPGNRDGVAIGPPWNLPAHKRADWLCTGQGGTILCNNDPQEGGGQAGNGNQDGARTAEDSAQAPPPDETRERPRPQPSVAAPDDAISRIMDDCAVGVRAKVFIVTRDDGQGNVRLKETHNLAHGFSEVVIPHGFNARGEFKPSPDPTRPYSGTMTASWGVVGDPNPYTGTVTGNRAKLARGRWDDTEGNVTISSGADRPAVQRHRIDATWDPEPETVPDRCSTGHDFTVTFAGPVPAPGPLDLRAFVEGAKQAGFPGTRPRTRYTTQTRAFHQSPPQPFSRDNKVVVPIGIYWDLPENCCDIRNAERKVIQFARAAIHGPNGRQGKGWGLDILPNEVGDAPNHDPTYTGHPNQDGNERPTPGGAGGTRRNSGDRNDVEQWDAPGMPKDLFDRLFAAQGASVYRQQFLSLLVCRPPGSGSARHRVPFYLAQGKVCQVAITTVRWDFPGQQGVRAVPGPRRGDPPQIPYRQPTITVSFEVRDGNCADLRAFLAANNLLEPFERPSGDARNLEILPQDRYQELDNSVTDWEANPFADVRFP